MHATKFTQFCQPGESNHPSLQLSGVFFELFFFFVAATELYLNRHSKPQTHLAHHPAKTLLLPTTRGYRGDAI
jgi:hypothetical protein